MTHLKILAGDGGSIYFAEVDKCIPSWNIYKWLVHIDFQVQTPATDFRKRKSGSNKDIDGKFGLLRYSWEILKKASAFSWKRLSFKSTNNLKGFFLFVAMRY